MRRWLLPVRFSGAMPLAAILMLSFAGSALAVPIITRTGTTPFYSPNVIMMAKRDGALPAQIQGSPLPGATDASAVAPLRLPASVGGGRLVPAAEGAGGIRLVLLFNGEDISPEQICAAPSSVETGPAGKGLDVYAVLCRGNEFFSHAHLRDEAVRSIGDPRYPKAMAQLFLALMPPEEQAGDELD